MLLKILIIICLGPFDCKLFSKPITNLARLVNKQIKNDKLESGEDIQRNANIAKKA